MRIICCFVSIPCFFTKVAFSFIGRRCHHLCEKFINDYIAILPPTTQSPCNTCIHQQRCIHSKWKLGLDSSFHCQVHKLTPTTSFLTMTMPIHVNQKIFRRNHFICLSSCLSMNFKKRPCQHSLGELHVIFDIQSQVHVVTQELDWNPFLLVGTF